MPIEIKYDPKLTEQDTRFVESSLAKLQNEDSQYLRPVAEINFLSGPSTIKDKPAARGAYDRIDKKVLVFNSAKLFPAAIDDILRHELFHARDEQAIKSNAAYLARREAPTGVEEYKKLKALAARSGYPSTDAGALTTGEFLATFVPDMDTKLKTGAAPTRTQALIDKYPDQVTEVYFKTRNPEIAESVHNSSAPVDESSFWNKLKQAMIRPTEAKNVVE